MYIARYACYYYVLGEQERLHLVVQLGCLYAVFIRLKDVGMELLKSETRKHPCRDAVHKIEDVGRVTHVFVICILLFAHAQNHMNWFM